jgi:branched-chain amino acid transport system ATP-binding protein
MMAADQSEPIVKIENVIAGYVPDVDILNGCDLHVQQGELIGIVGPNGAGKSTLLKTLFGLIPVYCVRPADRERLSQTHHL